MPAARSTGGSRPRRGAVASGPTSSSTRRCYRRTPNTAPYNVIVVEAEEDPAIRFVGNLVDGPDGALSSVDPHSVEIGEPVEVVFQQVADEVWMPRWTRPTA
ncbi:MAG: OB-fold domain-containing protein [Acidimicrobiia bacterium]|nr:OB-fold domain-containing protein [Acidimicrobiia bacterium]